MGHAPNINRNARKLVELNARDRAESLAGWRRTKGGTLQEVDTVAGCLARGAVVQGRCLKVEGCFRKVRLNLTFLAEHGFGEETIYEATKQFTCARVGGCRVEFDRPRYPGGTPLLALAEPPDTLLQFRCTACGGEGYRRTASSLLADLRRLGREDAERVGPLTLAKRMRRACGLCGEREWRAITVAIPAGGATGEEPEGDAAEPPSTGRGWSKGW